MQAVLVERETRRNKEERKQDAAQADVLRLRMDICDFDLSAFASGPPVPLRNCVLS